MINGHTTRTDLRDSGRVEEDADIVMFIYRESYYRDDLPEEEKNITEILIAKHGWLFKNRDIPAVGGRRQCSWNFKRIVINKN